MVQGSVNIPVSAESSAGPKCNSSFKRNVCARRANPSAPSTKYIVMIAMISGVGCMPKKSFDCSVFLFEWLFSVVSKGLEMVEAVSIVVSVAFVNDSASCCCCCFCCCVSRTSIASASLPRVSSENASDVDDVDEMRQREPVVVRLCLLVEDRVGCTGNCNNTIDFDDLCNVDMAVDMDLAP